MGVYFLQLGSEISSIPIAVKANLEKMFPHCEVLPLILSPWVWFSTLIYLC